MVMIMKSEQTKKNILLEAERHFIQKGIQSTQIKDIAEALNMSRRTVHRYFATKDELAFEIELVVLDQIQAYINRSTSDISGSALDRIHGYFNAIDIEVIRDQLRYTAEFDRYFQNAYPSSELEHSLIERIDPTKDILYDILVDGIQDGSFRQDLSADQMYHFISQSFFSLFQRLILREQHLKYEHCEHVDFQELFKDIMLRGIIGNKISF